LSKGGSAGCTAAAATGDPGCGFVVIGKKEGFGFMSNRETGTVKWFDNAKGYGFIQRGTGNDVFVHFKQIRGEGYRTLQEGQEVQFNLVQGQKGPQAEDVAVV
jgi:CspA family cold shock protein